jgi:hypothetical protein
MSKEAFKQIVSDAPDIQQAVTQHAMNDMANVQQAAQPAQDGKSLFGQILSEAAKDIGAELGRLGVQGQAEMAGALFNGNAYVPYGAGQNAPEPDKAQEQQVERGGRDM